MSVFFEEKEKERITQNGHQFELNLYKWVVIGIYSA